MTPAEFLFQQLAMQNVEVPAGSIEQGAKSLTLRLRGRVESIDQMRDLVVASRGGFADPLRGVRITPSGALIRFPPESPAAVESGPARVIGAALVVVLFGIGLPLVAARAARATDPRENSVALGAAGSLCAFCIFFLQATAAGRIAPLVATIPPAILLIGAGLRYRSPRW